MRDIVQVCEDRAWGATGPDAPTHDVEAVIESGGILCFPHLRFELHDDERALLDPAVADGKTKNISLRGLNDDVRGANPAHADALRRMIQRYRAQATTLTDRLFPHYRGRLKPGNPSYRPVAVEGRETSWRKDDTRLHVDSFPSNPMHGRRLLRVFHNLNPHGQARHWRVGEPFEDFARRFLPAIKKPLPGSSAAEPSSGAVPARARGRATAVSAPPSSRGTSPSRSTCSVSASRTDRSWTWATFAKVRTYSTSGTGVV